MAEISRQEESGKPFRERKIDHDHYQRSTRSTSHGQEKELKRMSCQGVCLLEKRVRRKEEKRRNKTEENEKRRTEEKTRHTRQTERERDETREGKGRSLSHPLSPLILFLALYLFILLLWKERVVNERKRKKLLYLKISTTITRRRRRRFVRISPHSRETSEKNTHKERTNATPSIRQGEKIPKREVSRQQKGRRKRRRKRTEGKDSVEKKIARLYRDLSRRRRAREKKRKKEDGMVDLDGEMTHPISLHAKDSLDLGGVKRKKKKGPNEKEDNLLSQLWSRFCLDLPRVDSAHPRVRTERRRREREISERILIGPDPREEDVKIARNFFNTKEWKAVSTYEGRGREKKRRCETVYLSSRLQKAKEDRSREKTWKVHEKSFSKNEAKKKSSSQTLLKDEGRTSIAVLNILGF
ncbi:hypothetical protein CSUI_006852, partial [Cystoisospora suis]